ncbi:MAG: chromate transporter [Clostridia bacterium]|nr:chromate transporter [Clostridia bacterium]
MKYKAGLYITLFFEMLKLSAFTFGGGYVIVPLMKRSFVEKHRLLNEKEMLDYTAVAQSAPGAVAVNAAILVGMKVGGATGAALTLIATILPPLVIISVIALVYEAFASSVIVAAALRGMRAGICAVIADAVISMIAAVTKEHRQGSPLQWLRILLIPASFIAVFVFKLNAAVIIVAGALVGCAVAFISGKAGERK